jgi:hypothetical protein
MYTKEYVLMHNASNLGFDFPYMPSKTLLVV